MKRPVDANLDRLAMPSEGELLPHGEGGPTLLVTKCDMCPEGSQWHERERIAWMGRHGWMCLRCIEAIDPQPPDYWTLADEWRHRGGRWAPLVKGDEA